MQAGAPQVVPGHFQAVCGIGLSYLLRRGTNRCTFTWARYVLLPVGR